MFSPTDRSVWVVVPFKGPVGSKRRLADLFDESERARLSLAMLDGVLDAVLGTGQVVRVLVMMPEDAPSPARHDPRLQFVAETPRSNDAPNDGSATDGLNRAIIQAQAAAQVAGAAPAADPAIRPSTDRRGRRGRPRDGIRDCSGRDLP